MAKSRRIRCVVAVKCAKDTNGKTEVNSEQIKDVWRKYSETVLNENVWDKDTSRDEVEG